MANSSESPPPSRLFSDLLKQESLRATFLPAIAPEELAAVEHLLDHVAAKTEEWCRAWTIFNPETILPVSIVNIIQFFHLPVDAIVERAKHSLWVYALDDVMDGRQLNEDEILASVSECSVVACGGIVPVHTELASSLSELRRDLVPYYHYSTVYPFWATSLIRTIDGMMYERWMQKKFTPLRLSDPLPPFDEYIYFARSSIAITYLWMTGLILEHDPSLANFLPQLYQLAEQCALVIRLANDWATFDRESSEGGLNAIAVRAHQLLTQSSCADVATLVSQARSELRDRIQAERQELQLLAGRIRTPTGIEQRFVRATNFSADLYLERDIRWWAPTLRARLAGTESSE